MADKEIPVPNTEQNSDRLWLISCVLITAIGVFLRFVLLGLKPFHHDEGVNGWFLTNLYRDGVYKYDPANYHGPTLYYIALGFVELFGLETVPVRWSVAIWGVLIVVLAFYLKPYIGRIGALFAALFLAISPGMVYISRYFIHEIFFVFLGLGLVLAVLLFIEKERAGPFALFWMALVLFVIFLPPVMHAAPAIADENSTVLWAIRIGLFAVEGTLIFFVIRMLREWNGGRPIYLLLAAACVALMFATKETTFITLGTMAIACVCIWAREQIAVSARAGTFPMRLFGAAAAGSIALALLLFYKLPEFGQDLGKRAFDWTKAGSADSLENALYFLIVISGPVLVYLLYAWDKGRRETDAEGPKISLAGFREKLGTGTDTILVAAAAASLIVYLIVLFFSSFFTYADGVSGFYEAYEIWLKTGSKDHTQNGVWAYVDWGMRSDGPIMILSLTGSVIALLKGRNRLAMFAGLWAFGLFLAYTIIPYKTPWLALSFLLPMCIAAGYAVNELIGSKNDLVKSLGLIAAAVAVSILSYQTYDLNFVRYDDEDAPMVYAHTSREFLNMVRDIEHFAEVSGKGTETAIDIVSPDYWPMVWYMKDYPKAIFHGRIAESNPPPEMIVAKKGEQDAEAARRYSANYERYGSYHLRSGVDLVLLVRKDLPGAQNKR